MTQWTMVPVEPTEEMLEAGTARLADTAIKLSGDRWKAINLWPAMLSASPPAPDVVGALEHYACNCEPGRCEFANMDDDGTDNVACGHRARAVLAQLRGEKP